MKFRRILLFHRKSFYRLYVKERGDVDLARAIERGDPAALGLEESHRENEQALADVQAELASRGLKVTTRCRRPLSWKGDQDLVISLGGDGTLMEVAWRLKSRPPLLGINSDPSKSVGALCAGSVADLPGILDRLEAGELVPSSLNRIRVRLNGQEVIGPCLNDVLFAHLCPAGLSRFEMAIMPCDQVWDASLESTGPFQHYRCSGIWVSSGAGSTAAIRSAGGEVMPTDSRELQFLVREPYTHPHRPAPDPLRGRVPPGMALVLVSRLRQGRIWADGADHSLALTFGQRLVLDNHPEPLSLIMQ